MIIKRDETCEIRKEIAWHKERILILKQKLEDLTPLQDYYCGHCKKTYSKDKCGYKKWKTSHRRIDDKYCWCDHYIENKLCCPRCGSNFRYTLNRVFVDSTEKLPLSKMKTLEQPYCFILRPMIIHTQNERK